MFKIRTDRQNSKKVLKRQKGICCSRICACNAGPYSSGIWDNRVRSCPLRQGSDNQCQQGRREGWDSFQGPPLFRTTEIMTLINDYCQDKLVTFGSVTNVTTSISREGALSGDDLTVTVAYKYDYLVLPGFISALTGGLNMNATTIMRME